MPKFVIAGFGNLGRRYLESICNLEGGNEVLIVEPDADRRNSAKAYELDSKSLKISTTAALDGLLHAHIDLAIVASTADVRLGVVRQMLDVFDVEYFILEKVLAQSLADLEELLGLLKNHKCWVNTPLLSHPLYAFVAKEIFEDGIILNIQNLNGLACNLIHYIDLVSRALNCEIIDIDCSKIGRQLLKSKRAGFYELSGHIEILFDRGSKLEVSSKCGTDKLQIEVTKSAEQWMITEENGRVICPSGERMWFGSVPLLSDYMSNLIKTILSREEPNLPTLEKSVSDHQAMLRAFLVCVYGKRFNRASKLNIT